MSELDNFGIEYLIVGGIAVGLHTEPRYTKDLDVLVWVDSGNVDRLLAALREFGAPTNLVTAVEFLQKDFVFFIGAPPWRVDILTSIPGVDFQKAYAERVHMDLGGKTVACISKEWLIRAKRASGRDQDLSDLRRLERA